MTTITSPHNPRLKELRKLSRRRERERSGRFLAEGEDLIAAAVAAGRPALAGYRTAGTAIGGAGFEDVEESVMASLSTLGSGTRAIGVYEQRFTKPVGPLCVYLHGVGDPGNVGAVLRSALAFGASCVALGPGCADPHSPKAVRASMGAVFSVGLARVSDVGETPGTRVALVAGAGEPIWTVRSGGEPIWTVGGVGNDDVLGARGGGGNELDQSVRDGLENAMPPARAGGIASGEHQPASLTLLVGAERDGLPDEVIEACERVAHIPIASESLNAAMAATVALYEMTRRSTRVPAS
ncbi:MAG TPA: RNA methyltransferase [Solirubrobacteraceae bacterium]|jgi:TrmH family RNA methyltransferase|nr:RNA methyltransferase [Solirubrobacteraceae bacterium]